jgi:hypothetical protein
VVVGRFTADHGRGRNLWLSKAITRLSPLDWSSKVESTLRIYGADRALLLIEGVAIAKPGCAGPPAAWQVNLNKRTSELERAHLAIRHPRAGRQRFSLDLVS